MNEEPRTALRVGRLARMFACALVFSLATLACDEGVTGPTAALNQEFTLSAGQSTSVEGAGIVVRFNRVTGDSRCPADAVCIQGGSADVGITVTARGNATRDYALRTGDMLPVQHRDLTIALVQVSPYPFSSRTISPDEYRVTLRVTR